MVQLHAKPVEPGLLDHALTLARTLRSCRSSSILAGAKHLVDTLTKSNPYCWVWNTRPQRPEGDLPRIGPSLSIAVEQFVVEEGSLAVRGMPASGEPRSWH